VHGRLLRKQRTIVIDLFPRTIRDDIHVCDSIIGYIACHGIQDNQAAVRLGIEALRYVKWLHEIKLLAASTKLPGETKTKVIRL
jgi:hypothetical protein